MRKKPQIKTTQEYFMKRTLRKYHRVLAPIIFLPLALTVLTGMLTTAVGEWQLGSGLISRGFLLSLHTGEIFGLAAIYPILNGIGVIGMLITGITLSGLFRKSRNAQNDG